MNNELNLPFCSHKTFRHFFDRHFDDISKPRMSDMSQMSALKKKIEIFDIDISPVGYVLTTLVFGWARWSYLFEKNHFSFYDFWALGSRHVTHIACFIRKSIWTLPDVDFKKNRKKLDFKSCLLTVISNI